MQHSQSVEEQEPLLLTMEQVMKKLQLGRSKIYDLINNEGLPVLRFGRAIRFQSSALQQWLNSRVNLDIE